MRFKGDHALHKFRHKISKRNQIMALIDCPECGQKVSDQADACPFCGRRLSDRLAELELDNELNRIDLEWERARKNYVFHGRLLGGESVPSKSKAVAMTVILLIVAAIPFGILIDLAQPNIVGFVVFMMVVIVLAVLSGGAWMFSQAAEYRKAEAAYRQKRDAARAKYEALDQGEPEEPAS